MRIKIINLQVVETYISRPVIKKLWHWIIGVQELDQYHFDVRIKIAELPTHLQLKDKDIVILENGVRLMIWSIDRGNMIKAKTIKMVVEDLRDYHPIEMHTVYPRVHGHISDRNTPRL